MTAWILNNINDLQLKNVPIPAITEHEALIHVQAAGICGSDIPRIYKTGAHCHPLIVGHEFSGIVEAVGNTANKNWIGKRVGIFPLIPCKQCISCQKHQYELCRNYSYLGSRTNGGFAEYAAVPVENLIELPENVSYAEAAMLEPMAVAVHAIRRLNIHPTDTVAVCGLGTIGLFITMFLQEAGLKNIFAIGNKEFQKQKISEFGIPKQHYCDSTAQSADIWIMEQTTGVGVNVFIECVGKNETYTQAINTAAPNGSIILVGNPYSNMELDKNTYWKLLRSQLTVKGTWNSSFTHTPDDDWHYVLDRLSHKKIAPATVISHTFPLEELEQGLQIMRDKTEDYGKIMCLGTVNK